MCVQLPCALRGAERLLRWLSEAWSSPGCESMADGIDSSAPRVLRRLPPRADGRANDEYRENLTPSAVGDARPQRSSDDTTSQDSERGATALRRSRHGQE